jgi:hypothetical protein
MKNLNKNISALFLLLSLILSQFLSNYVYMLTQDVGLFYICVIISLASYLLISSLTCALLPGGFYETETTGIWFLYLFVSIGQHIVCWQFRSLGKLYYNGLGFEIIYSIIYLGLIAVMYYFLIKLLKD